MQHLQPQSLLQGGKYRIERFISAGGFGCTYEGLHVLLKKRVAIKEFFVKDFCNRDESTAAVSIGITSKTALVHKLKNKFIEEAQSVCALKHSNIVNVYDVFEENGTAYYVMDYISGMSLNDIVKKNGAMGEEKAMRYILQVADALKYVHSRNRLHLDVKPGNVMIDEDDNAILIDFGASKQYDEEAGENTSTLMGKTPGFAPLEQMGNDVVKFYPSTDIYALGATLYKLLTGITPPSATLLASGEELQPMPSSISENVRNAVYKAMQTNKNKRPQSIDEFSTLLFTSKKDTEIVIKPIIDEKGELKEDTILAKENQEGATLEEVLFCKKYGLSTNINIAVDLGLSVKWATHNINAKSPAGTGTLIGWGQHMENDQHQKFENHYSDVEEYISGTCYDYCMYHNPNWRMPTKQEFNELSEKCNWNLIIEGSIQGFLIKSRTNGNAIFLRMAGIKENNLARSYNWGYYWTGTKSLIENNAVCFAFSSYWKAEHYYPVNFKLAIRPVCNE